MNIYNNITELIGKTPLVKLNNISKDVKADIVVKLEYFNPGGSAKDRPAYNMLKKALDKNIINKDTKIIEATSGNTGIGLAHAASALGLDLTLIIPDTMSIDKINHIKAMGATVKLTPGVFGMKKAFAVAEKMGLEIENSFIPSQITNPDNPESHRLTTGKEIWEDTDGKVDIFIAGIGTGGTITGVGEYLKSKNKDIKIIGLEPSGSPVLSGGKSGPHKLQGIGAGFVPDILNRDILDEVITINDDDALNTARNLARTEGIFVGISSGAAVYAAIKVAQCEENEGKLIVALLPDTGERYLNTELYNENIKDVFVS